MAAIKKKLGRIPCPSNCGHSVMLKENEAGTLTIACDECDLNAWAKKHTAAAAKWRKLAGAPAAEPAADPRQMPLPAVEKPAAAPAAPVAAPAAAPRKPTPPPPPPAKPKANPFNLLGSL